MFAACSALLQELPNRVVGPIRAVLQLDFVLKGALRWCLPRTTCRSLLATDAATGD
jgi:hypothetical protein